MKITVSIDKWYYDQAKQMADRIGYGVDGVIEDLIANFLEECFEDEVKRIEEEERDRSDEVKETLYFHRTLPSGGLLW